MSRLLGLLSGILLALVFAVSLWSYATDLFYGAQSPEAMARSPEASLAPTGATLIERRLSPRFWSPLSGSPGQVDLTYTTTDPFPRVVAFYDAALSSRGWRVERLVTERLGLYGVAFCRGEERGNVLDRANTERGPFNVSLIPRLGTDENCPNGRPWSSAVAFAVVGSFFAYVSIAARVRARSVRRRGVSLESARGFAHWIVFFLWVPYAIVAFRVGPEVETSTQLLWAGLLLTVVGIGISLLSLRTIAAHFDLELEVHAGHEVVRRGPYRFVRHPIYTGLVLHSLGACLATGNVLFTAGTLAVTIPALVLRARAEETLLRAALGSEYDRYMDEVPMLVPGLRVRGGKK